MLRTILLCVLFACPTARLRAQPADKRDALEKNIDRALAFLKNHQEKNGAWNTPAPHQAAVTGLAVMAFLAAGHIPGEGPYGANLERAIRFVLSQQKADGVIDSQSAMAMYNHGICTLMLAEVAGMTDAKLGKDCRAALEKAVKLVLQAQSLSGSAKGGWRYSASPGDADMSITGWQILALRAAKNLGCDIPAERIDMAVEYAKRCHDPFTGGFGYLPGTAATLPCTGVGILCLEICGRDPKNRDLALRAGSHLLKNPIQWNQGHFFYSIYYGAQGTFQLVETDGNKRKRNNYWESYRAQMHKLLFANQEANGSWTGNDGIGPLYATAMAVLALTVEYRLLPIYQRHEESRDKPR